MKDILENNSVIFSIEVKLSPTHQREFLQVVLKIIKEGRQEEGITSYNLQRDMENDYHYELNSEWQNKQSIEKYIKSQNFGALLGALKLLSLHFDIKIHQLSFQEGEELIKQLRNQ